MGAKPYISSTVVTKDYLTELEETLIVLIRTYLQRVTSNLSAQEFVDMAQAAVVLVDAELSTTPLSLSERKALLRAVLQAFGEQLSQPIPSLVAQIPEPILALIKRLIEYQKIMHRDGVEADLNSLLTKLLKDNVHSLSPVNICTALEDSNLINLPELKSQDSLNDLVNILCFKAQLQVETSSKATEADPRIKNHIEQAIANFKAKYQPLIDVTQPMWDDDLSISSPLFKAKNSLS